MPDEILYAAIKDLKSKKYIGTLEAFAHIRANELIYSMPRQMAEEINKSGNLVHYPATPERILGFLDEVHKILEEKDWGLADLLGDPVEYGGREVYPVGGDNQTETRFLASYVADYMDHLLKLTPSDLGLYPAMKKDDFGYGDLLKGMMQIFKVAQIPGMTDEEFGNRSLERLLAVLYPKEYMVILSENPVDWTYALSQKNQFRIEARLRSYCNESISIFMRLHRMIIDGVTNRVENRREIIGDYLADKSEQTYEDLLGSLQGRIEGVRSKIEEAKRYISDTEDCSEPSEGLVIITDFSSPEAYKYRYVPKWEIELRLSEKLLEMLKIDERFTRLMLER